MLEAVDIFLDSRARFMMDMAFQTGVMLFAELKSLCRIHVLLAYQKY